AFMAGFQSTTTFNKVFRDITGYSPRDYRKLYR
ncbi:MAG: AraC family transcriptional regulator, partial [Lachnospiraceae bacterium]|nr:AraC family transcriptional regulator [Lachnospiraceae bacterium]